MTVFTRLVIIGSEKRATLVVPSSDPVSTHLGAIVKLVQEPDPEGDLLTLMHPTGERVDLAASLASQEITDGSMLHLVRARDVAPEPEVSDVSDLVAHEYDSNASQKTSRGRQVASTIAAGVTAGALSVVFDASEPQSAVLITWGLATAASAAFALLGWRAPTRIGLAVSLSIATVVALTLPILPARATALGVPAVWLPLTWAHVAWVLFTVISATLGLVLGICERRVAPALGALAGVVLGVTGLITLTVTSSSSQAAAVTSLVAIAGLALLPTLALTLSGLTRLDDLRNEPQPGIVTRPRALTSIARAYEGLQWATGIIAVAFIIAIPALVLSDNGWFVALGVIVATLTMLRARVVPLAFASWALYLAAIGGLTVATFVHFMNAGDFTADDWLRSNPKIFVLSLVIAFVVSVMVVLVRPTAHAAARMRRQGDLIESLLALSVVPVMLGGFGLYTTLLGVF